MGRYSFGVRLLHPLLSAGLARRTIRPASRVRDRAAGRAYLFRPWQEHRRPRRSDRIPCGRRAASKAPAYDERELFNRELQCKLSSRIAVDDQTRILPNHVCVVPRGDPITVHEGVARTRADGPGQQPSRRRRDQGCSRGPSLCKILSLASPHPQIHGWSLPRRRGSLGETPRMTSRLGARASSIQRSLSGGCGELIWRARHTANRICARPLGGIASARSKASPPRPLSSRILRRTIIRFSMRRARSRETHRPRRAAA